MLQAASSEEEMNNERPDNQQKSGIICIIGPPNAGKSTLLNLFLGEKLSIISPKPQTTRNNISGILTTDTAQIVFLDTPGVHHSKETMNSYLVETAWQTLMSADTILLVLDASLYVQKPSKLDNDLQTLKTPLKNSGLPFRIGLNKTDLIADKANLLEILQHLNSFWPHAEIFPISASREQGTDALLENLISTLPAGPFLYPEDQLSTMPVRFFVTEIVREKIFLSLEQELPYSIAVKIEHWEEIAENNQVIINCIIYVSKKGHKKIVIGNKGQHLKKIGYQSRIEISDLIGKKVHLELWVKIKPDWNKDINFLKTLDSADA